MGYILGKVEVNVKKKIYIPIFSNGGNFASCIRHSCCDEKINNLHPSDLLSIVLNVIQILPGKDMNFRGKIDHFRTITAGLDLA